MMFISKIRDERHMADRQRYQVVAKNVLRAELKRRGLTYKDLALRLAHIGVRENERNLANKISRGTFSAAFFVECLDAIGCRSVDIGAS